MKLLSAKLLKTYFDERHNYGGYHAHWCPACDRLHEFAVDRPFRNGARWSFNGNLDQPTFEPSMNIRIGPWPDHSKKAGQIEVCHYFLRNGQIQYLGDSTHALAGQTIALPDLPQQVLDKIADLASRTDGGEI